MDKKSQRAESADEYLDRLIEEERTTNLETIRLAWDFAVAHGGMSGAEALRQFEVLIAGALARARQRGVLQGVEKMVALVELSTPLPPNADSALAVAEHQASLATDRPVLEVYSSKNPESCGGCLVGLPLGTGTHSFRDGCRFKSATASNARRRE